MHRTMLTLASVNAGVFISQEQLRDELYIITGLSGAGKTTWCQKAEAQARAEGYEVSGILSPAIYEKQEKLGITLIDLKTRERRLLATRKKTDQENIKCSWDFDEQTIAWANQVLRATGPNDVVFIDELGPLELIHGEGFREGVRLLDERRCGLTFVVIRPSLLSISRQRWPHMLLVHLKKQAV